MNKAKIISQILSHIPEGKSISAACSAYPKHMQQLNHIFARNSASAPPSSAPLAAEPFLNGSSSSYIEEMYYAWLRDPKSVHQVPLFHKFIS